MDSKSLQVIEIEWSEINKPSFIPRTERKMRRPQKKALKHCKKHREDDSLLPKESSSHKESSTIKDSFNKAHDNFALFKLNEDIADNNALNTRHNKASSDIEFEHEFECLTDNIPVLHDSVGEHEEHFLVDYQHGKKLKHGLTKSKIQLKDIQKEQFTNILKSYLPINDTDLADDQLLNQMFNQIKEIFNSK